MTFVPLHRPSRIRMVSLLAVTCAAMLGAQAYAATPAEEAEFGGRVAFHAIQPDTQYDGLIVHYRKDAGAHARAFVRRDLDRVEAELGGPDLRYERTLDIGADLVAIDAAGAEPSVRDAERVMMTLARNPAVAYVEPNVMLQAASLDPRYAEQWHYYESAGGIRLPGAWNIATGAGVTVAVLDTGTTRHRDTLANELQGYDFISSARNARDGDTVRDNNPIDPGDYLQANNSQPCSECEPVHILAPGDSSWHGTHVAGTIAALTDNNEGGAGVARNARILPVRVLGWQGGSLIDIADGIRWSAGLAVTGAPSNPNPAKVINLSLGGFAAVCSQTLQLAINDALKRGVVVVAAAGNSREDAAYTQPANCSDVITVAATGRQGQLASYSNFGAIVDVAAPGGDGADGVLSSVNRSTRDFVSGLDGYAAYQGTSMAAPHVAGLAALILSKAPGMTPAQVENLIKANARPLACSPQCGTGLIDAQRTLEALNGDSFEVDDEWTSAKPLYEGQPHSHTFHTTSDQDWVKFAVGPGTVSTVKLTGSVAATSRLQLYRANVYGVPQLVAQQSAKSGELKVSDSAANDAGLVIYYAMAAPLAGSPANTAAYTLSVTTEATADSHEPDDDVNTSKPLYSGQPQEHTFHSSSDVDWAVFAVGPNTRSRVSLSGNVSGSTTLQLFRDVNYPNSPKNLQLVQTAVGSSSLIVEGLSPADPVSAYYVKVSANAGNAAARDTYTLSVSTN